MDQPIKDVLSSIEDLGPAFRVLYDVFTDIEDILSPVTRSIESINNVFGSMDDYIYRLTNEMTSTEKAIADVSNVFGPWVDQLIEFGATQNEIVQAQDKWNEALATSLQLLKANEEAERYAESVERTETFEKAFYGMQELVDSYAADYEKIRGSLLQIDNRFDSFRDTFESLGSAPYMFEYTRDQEWEAMRNFMISTVESMISQGADKEEIKSILLYANKNTLNYHLSNFDQSTKFLDDLLTEAEQNYYLSSAFYDQITQGAGDQAQSIIDNYITPVSESWKKFMDDILLSDLAPVQNAEAFQAQYDTLFTAAQTNGADAVGALFDFVRNDYLPFMQSYTAEGANYNTLWDSMFGAQGELSNFTAQISTTDIENLSSSITNAIQTALGGLVESIQKVNGQLVINLKLDDTTMGTYLADLVRNNGDVNQAIQEVAA